MYSDVLCSSLRTDPQWQVCMLDDNKTKFPEPGVRRKNSIFDDFAIAEAYLTMSIHWSQ